MPYIDGCVQRVESNGDTFVIDDGGDYEASNTGGTIDQYEHTCEDCGAGFNDGDGYWTGIHDDHHVCDSCCNNEYTYAYSRRGNQYYIPNDRAVYIDGEYYDEDYLDENDIVQLHDGEYANRDDTVFIESTDEYYRSDDDEICYAEDTGRYELTDDCWQCEESNNWYTDDVDYVEVDGDKYHPDHAPEPEEEETVAECVWTPHVTGPTETN